MKQNYFWIFREINENLIQRNLIKMNNVIYSMVNILLKEEIIWDNEIIKEEINIFDFIRFQILTKIIYLSYIYNLEIDRNIMNFINNELKESVQDVFLSSLIWKKRKIKLWKWIEYKYWFDINISKDRVFLRGIDDYLIEVSLWNFLNNVSKLTRKQDYKLNTENNFIFRLHLNETQMKTLDENKKYMTDNVTKLNWNNDCNYIVNWDFKDWILEDYRKLSWF